MSSADRRREWCRLAIAGEDVALRSSNGSQHAVSSKCVARSQLLRDVVSTGGEADAGDTQVPLSEEVFRLWMHCVDAQSLEHAAPGEDAAQAPALASHAPVGCSGANASSRPGSEQLKQASPAHAAAVAGAAADTGASKAAEAPPVDALGNVIMAADVLIDEATKHSAAYHLAAHLRQPGGGDAFSKALEELPPLPDHLLLTVLGLIPVEHTFHHLPTTFHTASLRAHHPSIDSHRSLHIHRIAPELMHAALTAAANLSTLQEVSLAGATLPPECGACSAILPELPSVTALCLQDIGMTDSAAAALADALPAMPQLQRLDLSGNRVSSAALASLSRGLRGCPKLLALKAKGWLVTGRGMGLPTIQDAASAVATLRQLTSLSFGIDNYVRTETIRDPMHPLGSCMSELAAEHCSMPQLEELELLCDRVSGSAAQHVARMLEAAPRLLRLHLFLPDMIEMVLNGPEFPPEPALPCESTVVGDTICRLTAVTSLKLHFCGSSKAAAAGCIRNLASMPQLRELWLLTSNSELRDPIAVAAADVLPQLTALTQLHAFATPEDEEVGLPWIGTPVASRLAEAAAAAAHLRELTLPLDLRSIPAVLRPLRAATHLLRLHIVLQVPPDVRRPAADAPDFCRIALPLLPHVSAVSATDPFLMTPLQLRLFTVSPTAFSSLRVCSVTGAPPVAAAQVQGLLNAVSCMTSLQMLQCVVRLHPAPAGAGTVDVGPLCRALPCLCSLTSLHWDVADLAGTVVGQREVLHACSGLRGLRALRLDELQEDAFAEFEAVVPQLPLRVLEVRVDEWDSAPVVADVIARMPHLREAAVHHTDNKVPVQVPESAVHSLPACWLAEPV